MKTSTPLCDRVCMVLLSITIIIHLISVTVIFTSLTIFFFLSSVSFLSYNILITSLLWSISISLEVSLCSSLLWSYYSFWFQKYFSQLSRKGLFMLCTHVLHQKLVMANIKEQVPNFLKNYSEFLFSCNLSYRAVLPSTNVNCRFPEGQVTLE